MPVPLAELMAELSSDDRAEVEEGAAAIVLQNRTLRDIREGLGLTQEELASALETSQANVSRLEARSDLKVSTIARAVAALGGTLQIVVNVPGRPPATLDFGGDRRTGRKTDRDKPPKGSRRKAA